METVQQTLTDLIALVISFPLLKLGMPLGITWNPSVLAALRYAMEYTVDVMIS
jgi:hypothetical protein